MKPSLCFLLLFFAKVFSYDSLLKFITIDTAPHDGTRRFLWSAHAYTTEVEVLEKPSSETTKLSPLVDYISSIESITNVLYCDSTFLALAGTSLDIMERWKGTGKDVLLDIAQNDVHFNVNCIMGKASHVLQVIKQLSVTASSSRDTGYTISEMLNFQSNISIALDVESTVFLNIDRFSDAVGYTADRLKFVNFETNDRPPILIGSVNSYNTFIRLTNHVPGVFDLEKLKSKKKASKDEFMPWNFFKISADTREYFNQDQSHYKIMVTALFVKEDAPFLDMVLDRFKSLQWLSKRRVMLVFCRLKHRDHVITRFIANMPGKSNYHKIIFYNSTTEETKTNFNMHKTVLDVCSEYNCTWIWNQDSDVINIQGSALQELAIFNLSLIAPLTLSSINSNNPRPNFWGGTTDIGFYERSPDYFDIANRRLAGLFAVPYVGGAYLVKAEVIKDLSYYDPVYKDSDLDVVFCNSVRKSGHFFFLKADKVDCMFINGRTNESIDNPFFEHFAENKSPFYLGYYMKWDHIRQRDWKHSSATPMQNPCDQVYIMELFTENFSHNIVSAALSSNKWSLNEWYKQWNVFESISLDDLGFSEGWAAFSLDYMHTAIYRKFGYQSPCTPIQSFVMKMTNESTATESLEGLGVFTALISISSGSEGGSIIFNDNCEATLKIGDFVLFPSRLTHTIRFIPPKNGTMMNLISFYN